MHQALKISTAERGSRLSRYLTPEPFQAHLQALPSFGRHFYFWLSLRLSHGHALSSIPSLPEKLLRSNLFLQQSKNFANPEIRRFSLHGE
jgi:hypothetical protein